jgi:hypothetical protein
VLQLIINFTIIHLLLCMVIRIIVGANILHVIPLTVVHTTLAIHVTFASIDV